MPVPVRGTQSLVDQMGWTMQRPALTLLEVAWRWCFGIPFLLTCWFEARQIVAALPAVPAAFEAINPQNPWIAATRLSATWTLLQPQVTAVLWCLIPAAGAVWAVVSGIGRTVILRRMDSRLHVRLAAMILLQAVWLMVFAIILWAWLRSMAWAAATHITVAVEPDLVGYSIWVIFLTLFFFILWALVNWPFSVAPVLMGMGNYGPVAALMHSFQLGRAYTGKLVETNLVMGISKLALLVLAMVLSAAPLPFSDQLGPDTMHVVWGAATVFFFVACDYFHVVRLKGFVEFWKIFQFSAG